MNNPQSEQTNNIINQLLGPASNHLTEIDYLQLNKDYILSIKREIYDIINFENQESKKERFAELAQEFLIKADNSDSTEENILYCIIHIYAYIFELLNTNINSIDNIDDYTNSIYRILAPIAMYWNTDIKQKLDIEEICVSVTRAIFSPRTMKKDVNKGKMSNTDIFLQLNETSSNEQILHSFHMPGRDQSIWRPLHKCEDLISHKYRIEFLSFFQKYSDATILEKILSYKFRTQKSYIAMLSNEKLKEFYDLSADSLVGLKREPEVKFPHLVQKYEAKLMELLVSEMSSRFGDKWNHSYLSPFCYKKDYEKAREKFPSF